MKKISSTTFKKIATFLVLTFTITWGAQALIFFISKSGSIEISNENLFLLFIDVLTFTAPQLERSIWAINSLVFGPAIAAFITIAIFEGRSGIMQLLKKTFNPHVKLQYILLALAIPVAMGIVSLLVGLATSGFSLDNYESILDWRYILPFALYMIVFTGLSEEVGWRGFLQDNLNTKYNVYKSSVIVGLFWGVWHFPYQIRSFINEPAVLVFSLVGLLAGIVGWSIVVGWLYKKSDSLPVIFLLHGWSNVITSYFITSSNNYVASVVYAIMPWVIVYILERYQKSILYEKVQHDN
jgi:membrane protease YdiL (CAAX protease family)